LGQWLIELHFLATRQKLLSWRGDFGMLKKVLPIQISLSEEIAPGHDFRGKISAALAKASFFTGEPLSLQISDGDNLPNSGSVNSKLPSNLNTNLATRYNATF
jgi:hypothetical protein